MPIDKFGHVQPARSGIKRKKHVPYLELTSAGILDMGGKRIRRLADPVEDLDSVNKKYLLNHLSEDIEKAEKKTDIKIHSLSSMILEQVDLMYGKKFTDLNEHVDNQIYETAELIKETLDLCISRNEANHKIDEIINVCNTNITNLSSAIEASTAQKLQETETEISGNFDRKLENLKIHVKSEVKKLEEHINNLSKGLLLDSKIDALQTKLESRLVKEFDKMQKEMRKTINDNIDSKLIAIRSEIASLNTSIGKLEIDAGVSRNR